MKLSVKDIMLLLGAVFMSTCLHTELAAQNNVNAGVADVAPFEIEGITHGITVAEATQILKKRGHLQTRTLGSFKTPGSKTNNITLSWHTSYNGERIVTGIKIMEGPYIDGVRVPTKQSDTEAQNIFRKLKNNYGEPACKTRKSRDGFLKRRCKWTVNPGGAEHILRWEHTNRLMWTLAFTGPANAAPAREYSETMPPEEMFRRGLKLYKEKNYQKAAWWLQKAAQKGHLLARYNLGNLFYHGLGVQQNYRMAEGHYRYSALRGHAKSIHAMGVMFANGIGQSVDLFEAADYFKAAIKAANRTDDREIARLAAKNLSQVKIAMERKIEALERDIRIQLAQPCPVFPLHGICLSRATASDLSAIKKSYERKLNSLER